MTHELVNDTAALWQRLVESHRALGLASQDFLAKAANRVEVVRRALRGRERDTALLLSGSLTTDERKELFGEWVHLSRCAHGPFETAWRIIVALPREWVLAHIEPEVDSLLQSEEYDDYWMFLQLYEQLDRHLMLKLARRASQHAQPEIRELGADYLARVEQ